MELSVSIEMRTVLLFTCLLSAVLAEYKSYDGYTVYEVTPLTPEDSALLQELYNSEQFDFWSKSRAINHPVSVMVSPDHKGKFISIMEQHRMSYKVSIENAETTFSAERERQARAPRVPKGRVSFDTFHRYDTILDYLAALGEQYPDIVTVEDYGTSYEGRTLRLLRVGSGSPEGKPTIFIEGAIHAREFIAPPVVLYTAQQLIENPENRALIENANWILVPVTNPDGYEYAHTNDRMWRKTRRTGTVCHGVDGNRNFDLAWGGPGTSTNECSEIFIGPYPHSEPEVASLVEVALAEERIDLYVAVHSYGNWILYPWGYTYEVPDNVDDLHEAGLQMAAAIEAVAGTRYVVGNSAALLYFAAGASDDWFKGGAGATLSYTLELPGGGNQGFDIPAYRIQPVVTETWPGIVALYNFVLENVRK